MKAVANNYRVNEGDIQYLDNMIFFGDEIQGSDTELKTNHSATSRNNLSGAAGVWVLPEGKYVSITMNAFVVNTDGSRAIGRFRSEGVYRRDVGGSVEELDRQPTEQIYRSTKAVTDDWNCRLNFSAGNNRIYPYCRASAGQNAVCIAKLEVLELGNL